MFTFLDEILEQPEVLHRCVDYYRTHEKGLRASLGQQPSRIIFTGMGASLFASLPAVYYLNAHGKSAYERETSELLYYRKQHLRGSDWLVIISQSGETIEVRRLLAALGRRRPRVAAITNNPHSRLARKADCVLPLLAGVQNFASTKTYSASVLVALLLASVWGNAKFARLLDSLARSLRSYERTLARAHREAGKLAEALGKPQHIVLLGRGPSLASALEGALLFKEVCARPAEGMGGAEFRHGPMELLERPLGAVLFAEPGPTLRLHRRLLSDLLGHKACVLWISSARSTARGVQVFRLPRPPAPLLIPLFEIVPVQFITAELARCAGREPGRLRIAQTITQQE